MFDFGSVLLKLLALLLLVGWAKWFAVVADFAFFAGKRFNGLVSFLFGRLVIFLVVLVSGEVSALSSPLQALFEDGCRVFMETSTLKKIVENLSLFYDDPFLSLRRLDVRKTHYKFVQNVESSSKRRCRFHICNIWDYLVVFKGQFLDEMVLCKKYTPPWF